MSGACCCCRESACFSAEALGLAYAFGRDNSGYFQDTLEDVRSPTVAVTTEDLALTIDAGSPAWLVDALDADLRLRVGSSDGARPIFVGIGPAADVASYLDGVAHDQIIEVADRRTPSVGACSATALTGMLSLLAADGKPEYVD